MSILEQSDLRAWDDTIRHRGGHPLQSAAWGDLKEQFGWRAIRLASRDGTAGAQLLIRPMLGLSVAYVPRGPVFSGRRETDDALIKAIGRHALRMRAAFIRLEPDIRYDTPQAAHVERLLGERRYQTVERTLQPRGSLTIDLRHSEDELLASFSKGHRADIRRAERDGVVVRDGTDADVTLLHQLLEATQQRKSFAIHNAGYYRALIRAFGENARLFVAERAGEAIGASLVLAWGRHGVYLAAGSNEHGLRHRSGHLLQWHAIRWARARGAQTYDLWGIPDARARLELDAGGLTESERTDLLQEATTDPLDGVYRFKKGWGAQAARNVPAYDRVYFRPAYWLWQRRRETSG